MVDRNLIHDDESYLPVEKRNETHMSNWFAQVFWLSFVNLFHFSYVPIIHK